MTQTVLRSIQCSVITVIINYVLNRNLTNNWTVRHKLNAMTCNDTDHSWTTFILYTYTKFAVHELENPLPFQNAFIMKDKMPDIAVTPENKSVFEHTSLW